MMMNHSGGSNHSNSNGSGTNSTTVNRDCYVVQRCWFDGPKVDPPVDYLRILTREQAERVALESAHAYGAEHQAVVRTIALPSSNNNSDSSNGGGGILYAYSTAHVLFWVRRVVVTVEVGCEQLSSSSNQKPCIHAILTNGIIGGGLGGRRGTEISTGRVFWGPSSAEWALRTVQGGQLLQQGGSYVTCLPWGLPDADYQQRPLLSGWPDHPGFRGETVDTGMDDSTSSGKRQHHNHYLPAVVSEVDMMMDDTTSRPPKRHCHTGLVPFAPPPPSTMDGVMMDG